MGYHVPLVPRQLRHCSWHARRRFVNAVASLPVSYQQKGSPDWSQKPRRPPITVCDSWRIPATAADSIHPSVGNGRPGAKQFLPGLHSTWIGSRSSRGDTTRSSCGLRETTLHGKSAPDQVDPSISAHPKGSACPRRRRRLPASADLSSPDRYRPLAPADRSRRSSSLFQASGRIRGWLGERLVSGCWQDSDGWSRVLRSDRIKLNRRRTNLEETTLIN